MINKPRYKILKMKDRKRKKSKSSALTKKRRLIWHNRWLFKQRGKPKKNYKLRYIGFLLMHASVRHNISKQDLEVGLYVYNIAEFSREKFSEIVFMICGKQTGQFKRFLQKGYIIEESRLWKFQRKQDEQVRTGNYIFSNQFRCIIRELYDRNDYLLNIDGTPNSVDLGPKAQAKMNDMIREIKEIKSGKKKPLEILKTKQ